MNVTGIIAEYNPFHNGHAFHIEETRKNTNADYCIAVISGSFVQRGAPALVNKYDRTKMEWKMNGLIDALKRATSHKSYTINKK